MGAEERAGRSAGVAVLAEGDLEGGHCEGARWRRRSGGDGGEVAGRGRRRHCSRRVVLRAQRRPPAPTQHPSTRRPRPCPAPPRTLTSLARMDGCAWMMSEMLRSATYCGRGAVVTGEEGQARHEGSGSWSPSCATAAKEVSLLRAVLPPAALWAPACNRSAARPRSAPASCSQPASRPPAAPAPRPAA